MHWLQQESLEKKEEVVYKRAPIGKRYKRSLKFTLKSILPNKHPLPETAKAKIFGMKTPASEAIEETIRTNIFNEPNEISRMYSKSHGRTDPGKPKITTAH